MRKLFNIIAAGTVALGLSGCDLIDLDNLPELQTFEQHGPPIIPFK